MGAQRGLLVSLTHPTNRPLRISCASRPFFLFRPSSSILGTLPKHFHFRNGRCHAEYRKHKDSVHRRVWSDRSRDGRKSETLQRDPRYSFQRREWRVSSYGSSSKPQEVCPVASFSCGAVVFWQRFLA